MSRFIPHGAYSDEEWQIQIGDTFYRPSQGEELAKRITELEEAIRETIADLCLRGEVDSDGRGVVNLSASTWNKLNDAIKPPSEVNDE